ncbi:5604_t:CDS:2 [Acaulospora colombiana]|uniref:5604_t:CDS:1 n=1 Tax=Acaulospora colombiana TaxID=27376 RepID=A0ACA9NVU5_9GLOM|nr:5604_t:CDS:2 [Acaulospora colombiana]
MGLNQGRVDCRRSKRLLVLRKEDQQACKREGVAARWAWEWYAQWRRLVGTGTNDEQRLKLSLGTGVDDIKDDSE